MVWDDPPVFPSSRGPPSPIGALNAVAAADGQKRGRPGAAVVRTPDPNRGVLPDDIPDEQMQLILDSKCARLQSLADQ